MYINSSSVAHYHFWHTAVLPELSNSIWQKQSISLLTIDNKNMSKYGLFIFISRKKANNCSIFVYIALFGQHAVLLPETQMKPLIRKPTKTVVPVMQTKKGCGRL